MMSLYVMSACQLSCQQCIMAPLMEKDARYEMSIQEVKDFLDSAERSNYQFHYRLTGGEPLLWPHLLEALRLLRQSKSCLSLSIISNGIHAERVSDELIDLIDCLRLSRYLYNAQKVDYLLSKYPDTVALAEKETFYQNPEAPVPGYSPVDCANPELMFYNNRVYACPHAEPIAIGAGVSHIRLYNELAPNFKDGLAEIRHNQEEDLCSRCIGNRRVRARMEQVINISGSNNNPDRMAKHYRRWSPHGAWVGLHNIRAKVLALMSGSR
jgi:hypothetical protein